MMNMINKTFIPDSKCHLPVLSVELLTEKYDLDPRPEYARASIISKDGKLYAEITGRQISSRLKSILDADVLLHLPPQMPEMPFISKGAIVKASVLKTDFITRYDE
jgi:gephyrin